MAYNRWREKNLTLIEKQQALEVLDGFKTKVKKHGKTKDPINPTYGKISLQKLEKIRTQVKNKESMTITEVLSLQNEITDIDLTGLIELSEETQQIDHGIQEEEQEEEDSDDASYDSDTESDSDAKFDLFGNMSNMTDEKNPFAQLGNMAGNMMGSMLNPMLNALGGVVVPSVELILPQLQKMLEDPNLKLEKRKICELTYAFYKEIGDIYKDKTLSATEQTIKVGELNKKYPKDEIESFVKSDEVLSQLMMNSINTEEIEQNMNNLGEQCIVS